MSQSIDRAVQLLRLVAADADGKRLVDLQRETGLTKPTVHRILRSLQQNGLVDQEELGKRYILGQEISILGWTANRQAYDLRELAANQMSAVAQRTGDTSFLTVRSGLDAVCLDRQSGSYPVKAFTIDVGNRRPIGVGAGGIILLASLPDDEFESVMEGVEERLDRYPMASIQVIRRAADKARERGYALSDGFVLDGVRGIGVSIRDVNGVPIAALSVAAIKSRITPDRVPELVSLLKSHASQIEQRIASAMQRKTTMKESTHRSL